MTDARRIVEQWLIDHGYEGLWNSDGECACELGELAPCGEISPECYPGVRSPCPENCGEHNWHMKAKPGDDHAD